MSLLCNVVFRCKLLRPCFSSKAFLQTPPGQRAYTWWTKAENEWFAAELTKKSSSNLNLTELCRQIAKERPRRGWQSYYYHLKTLQAEHLIPPLTRKPQQIFTVEEDKWMRDLVKGWCQQGQTMAWCYRELHRMRPSRTASFYCYRYQQPTKFGKTISGGVETNFPWTEEEDAWICREYEANTAGKEFYKRLQAANPRHTLTACVGRVLTLQAQHILPTKKRHILSPISGPFTLEEDEWVMENMNKWLTQRRLLGWCYAELHRMHPHRTVTACARRYRLLRDSANKIDS